MSTNQSVYTARVQYGGNAAGLSRNGRAGTPDFFRGSAPNRSSGQELPAPGVRVVKAGAGPYAELSCIVLSDRGMYLRSSEQLVEGDILQLKLTLPYSTETLEVDGEVTPMALCRIDAGPQPGTGILFIDPSEKVLRQIRNYIDWEMTDVDAWDPAPSEFKPIDDFDVLVQAALFYGPKPGTKKKPGRIDARCS